YGSVPVVAAIDLPRRSSTESMSEPSGTTMAAHSGWEYRSITWMGDPFDRASNAADPAVEPTSTAPARSASLALLDPADCSQVTVTPSSSSSNQPCSLMTKLSGL